MAAAANASDSAAAASNASTDASNVTYLRSQIERINASDQFTTQMKVLLSAHLDEFIHIVENANTFNLKQLNVNTYKSFAHIAWRLSNSWTQFNAFITSIGLLDLKLNAAHIFNITDMKSFLKY